MSERFVVRGVTGWRIPPPGVSQRVSGEYAAATVYMVLDRAYCHRVVAEYRTDNGRGDAYRLRKATEHAAELNARPDLRAWRGALDSPA